MTPTTLERPTLAPRTWMAKVVELSGDRLTNLVDATNPGHLRPGQSDMTELGEVPGDAKVVG